MPGIYKEDKGDKSLKRFAVRVFGCQMNAYDGDRIDLHDTSRLDGVSEEDAEVVIS